MKAILIFTFVIIAIRDGHAMSEAQFKSAAKLLRNVCQPKTKISNAQVDAFHKGEFSDVPEVACYMECVLRTGQITKDGKLNADFLRNQVGSLPPNIAEPAIVTVDHCVDSMKSSDKCTAAYEFYKCFYDDNPGNFFLP